MKKLVWIKSVLLAIFLVGFLSNSALAAKKKSSRCRTSLSSFVETRADHIQVRAGKENYVVQLPIRVEKPFFYRIQKDGKTSYLLGTIHLGVELSAFPKEVRDAIASSKKVLVESEADNQQLMQQEMMKMKVERWSVRRQMKPKEWKKLVNTIGWPEANLAELHPGILLMLYSSNKIQQSMKQSELFEGKMDIQIMDMARDHSIEVGYLEEGGNAMMAMFGQTTVRHLQAEINRKTILANKLAQVKESPEYLIASYLTGDFYTVLRNLTGGQSIPGLIERNHQWMDTLTDNIDQGSAFIAVGALHLEGIDGVVPMLRDRGYYVERVEF